MTVLARYLVVEVVGGAVVGGAFGGAAAIALGLSLPQRASTAVCIGFAVACVQLAEDKAKGRGWRVAPALAAFAVALGTAWLMLHLLAR